MTCHILLGDIMLGDIVFVQSPTMELSLRFEPPPLCSDPGPLSLGFKPLLSDSGPRCLSVIRTPAFRPGPWSLSGILTPYLLIQNSCLYLRGFEPPPSELPDICP
ncbi:hypothetical protein Bbelb_203760 [Branchiostoma belcheri]|nr:hypothetical protein Bbelb_203760 [Branchiostoma belcheri]